ncbi:MAG: histidine kinase [Planctomycetes bacterium]|nr:histidine kinase [Planctomycetota bacterium]
MYVNNSPRTPSNFRSALIRLTYGLVGILALSDSTVFAQSNVIRNITGSTERMEMTVNSSRILTLEKRIPRMVVNNPDLVTVTAISANQIQLAARKPGVTQVNLWDEDGNVFTVDVTIYGDVRELQLALKRLFPQSSVNVVRLTNSLVLEGFVERPEAVSPIIRLAEDYAPKVINNITVGGVQQVLLKVKVMEVSRTKLRNLGVDWAQISGSSFVSSSISGLISSVSSSNTGVSVSASGDTMRFGVVNGNNSFFAFLEALEQNNVAKILADPTIVAISGRPAHFNVGGELPIVIPSGLGQATVEYKAFGTQVDFLPIVLGNGNIRLEVRPRVSEIDDTRSIEVQGFTVPALKVREVDTGVELKAGQTLALAGLVQTRVDALERSVPYLGNLPYIGAAFRSVKEQVNEIELLILVTPEFVDGMEPHQVPTCGPGMESISPTNKQLYFGGHLEVPANGPCGPGGGCNIHGGFGSECSNAPVGMSVLASDGRTGQVVESYSEPVEVQTPIPMPALPEQPAIEAPPVLQPAAPRLEAPAIPQPLKPDPNAMKQPTPRFRNQVPAQFSREKLPHRSAQRQPTTGTTTPGLIGPLGYDVE